MTHPNTANKGSGSGSGAGSGYRVSKNSKDSRSKTNSNKGPKEAKQPSWKERMLTNEGIVALYHLEQAKKDASRIAEEAKIKNDEAKLAWERAKFEVPELFIATREADFVLRRSKNNV